MREVYKTEEQFISGVAMLRQQIAELEASEAGHRRAEGVLLKYRMAVESSTDLIAAVDCQYVYFFANETFLRYNRLTQNQVVGHTAVEILGEEVFRKTVKPNVDRCLRGETVEYEMQRPYPGLGKRYLNVRYYPLKNSDKETMGVVAIIRDITERKQAEEELRASEERYHHLFENLNDAALLADAETGQVLETNQQGEILLGMSRKEIIGMHQSDLHPPDKAEEYKRRFATHVAKGRAADYEGEVIRKDGTIVPVHIGASPLTIQGRHLILGLFHDITERKRAEETLRQSEQKYKNLFELAPYAIATVDKKGVVTSCNTAVLSSTGYSKDEIVGKHFFKLQFLRVSDIPMYMKIFNSLLKGNVPKPFEVNYRTKDGASRWVQVHVGLLEVDGSKEGAQVAFEDITERKRAEAEEKWLQQELYLSRRLASIGELAAGVAHEINNPLTGILGFSQRLLGKSSDEEFSHDLQIINSEAQRAAKVVQNLLTFARRREPKKEYSNINDILQKALELRAYELKTSNIEVVTDLTPSLPEIMVDFQQIQEVFLNIILNAEQVMNETHGGGKLIIKTRQTKDHIRISFTDDGPGIPPEYLDNVFDPFFTTRAEKGGTGLGLSACHGIVTEHGGRICAKSKPGKGATFFVELPLSLAEVTLSTDVDIY